MIWYYFPKKSKSKGNLCMTIIQNQNFDQERALYGSMDLTAVNCRFDGPADGESAFKESKNIIVQDCYFNLRYPFWHDQDLSIQNCQMTPLCRAALWYSENITITDSQLHGIKALRECCNAEIKNCDILSAEFGWFSRGLTVENSRAEGEYLFLRARDLVFRNFSMKGKYSFQYIENAIFENCDLDTKDAFWHAKNVTVKNCTVKGEYLAWYCENVTFDHCTIIGTQPLCYCTNLTLIDCQMLDADLAFEKSHVNATVTTPMISIKAPASGSITVPAVGELIDADMVKVIG